MKKILAVLGVLLMLTGCSLQTFEKVEDGNAVPVMAQPGKILIDLPDAAAAPTMQGDSGSLYFCGEYDLALEILPSGNLNSTLQTLTGFSQEHLHLVKTLRKGNACYEGAWSFAGESGDQVGQILVLDDGSFHYCVVITAPAEAAGACSEEWRAVMASVSLTEK